MKRFATNLLRMLIGIGFTFSLVIGATLTLLTFCEGSGNNLTLSRTGPDWGWGGGAAIAWALTLFWWLCWRRLPATKPTRMFPLLERWRQSNLFTIGAMTVSAILSIGAIAASAFLMLDMGLRLISHAAGASWPRFGLYSVMTFFNSQWILSAWKHRSERKLDANK